MTTEEFLLRRKSPDWRLSTIVDKNSFKYVNRIHPLKQRIVKEIVAAAKIDPYVKRIIIFGSSIRYDCDISSDLDICIDWTEAC